MMNPMSSYDIVQSYRNRDNDARKHIKILADLNATTPTKITAILVEAGEAVPATGGKYHMWTTSEEQEAHRMFDSGMSLKDIANKLDRTVSSVRGKLQPYHGKKETSPTVEACVKEVPTAVVAPPDICIPESPQTEQPAALPILSDLCTQILSLADTAAETLLKEQPTACAYYLGQLVQKVRQLSDIVVGDPPCGSGGFNELV